MFITYEDGHQFNSSLLVFQLQPIFRVLRLGKPIISLTNSIKTGEHGISLAEVVACKGSFSFPYWIGHEISQGSSIRIDPNQKTATLVSGKRQLNREFNLDEGDGKDWEVTIQDPKMDILTVNEKDDHLEEIDIPVVTGEELERLRKTIIDVVKYRDERLH
ncbi:hypothetical protein McanMca71_003985 [Microsporum canis]